MTGLATITLACVVVVLAGLAVGYRPVVLQTGSMGESAPAGSLVVASPRDATSIQVGDIVVMQRDDALPITHRVIDINDTDVGLVAVTQGDANATPDPAPYAFGDQELVARWVVPEAGALMADLRSPYLLLAAAALAVVIATVLSLRRIWSERSTSRPPRSPSPPTSESASSPSPPPPSPTPPTSESASSLPPPPPPPASEPELVTSPTRLGRLHMHRSRVGAAVVVVAALTCVGVVWALYTSTASVPANTFATADCFSARLSSMQSGETVHTTNGIVTETITAVDPTRTFVMASVRSLSNEPADSSVQLRLTAGTTLDIERITDDGSPPAVTVAWSVVEYACGVSVQRGVAVGTGTNQIDIPITSVDTASSFVLVETLAAAGETEFGNDELTISELSASDTLTVRAASSAALSASRSFAWQVVTFTDPDDIDVQTAPSLMSVGVTSTSITLGSTVDPATTFITAFATSDSAGADIGERLIRARLVDGDTVVVDRGVGGDALDVQVQVVSLLDGTTVRHGSVDLGVGVATASVPVPPVDTSRAAAFSTVAIPGPLGGGLTDHVADDIVGEASATVAVTDSRTVTITRDATASNASFGWQLIEWAGPGWWDTNYGFRQRIDVATSTAAAPGAYTVSLDVDHASLVADGFSRSDGDDIRVLRWDGSAWTELDRVLDDGDGWDAVDTTIRFRTVDAIGVDDTATYWLYMDNAAAPAPPSDPEAVFLLVEDFESGDLGDFEDRTGGTGWYQADPWTRRIPITIPAGRVGSDLTDFVVFVSLTEADLATNAQADGSDVRFTSTDGTTALAHEIEAFDSATGTVDAWVRVPTLTTATDTTIYLYYGAPNAPAQADSDGTWPDDVEAVWHLNRDPEGSAPQLDDSSARNHDGLSLGAMTTPDLVVGLAGSALDLDGGDDAVQSDPIGFGQLSALTVSGWVRFDTLTVEATLFSKADDATDRQIDLTVLADGSVRARLLLDSGEAEATTSAAIVATGTWQHVAARWDGATLDVIVDGLSQGTVGAVGEIDPRPQMPILIGNLATQDRGVDGRLDEFRVESVARSIDWLAAVAANQDAPGTFLVVGAPQAGTYFDQGTWLYRKPVVVDSDQVTTDLFDFALLVQVTEPRLQATAQACGCDLVFTSADGTTRLDHVVETYNSGTGALTAWVSVPVLSSAEDTEFFVYYGNPTAVDQQDPPAVFGSDADIRILGAP